MSKPQKKFQYKELCERHKISNKNFPIIDLLTRWKEFDIFPHKIITAWDKRMVLNVMETSFLKDGK